MERDWRDFVWRAIWVVAAVMAGFLIAEIASCALPQQAISHPTSQPVQQQGAVNVADVEKLIDARLADISVTTSYDTDVWLNRGMMAGVLFLAWWFARSHGYDAGRQRRLKRENNVVYAARDEHVKALKENDDE